jgi:hypothetical protein
MPKQLTHHSKFHPVQHNSENCIFWHSSAKLLIIKKSIHFQVRDLCV